MNKDHQQLIGEQISVGGELYTLVELLQVENGTCVKARHAQNSSIALFGVEQALNALRVEEIELNQPTFLSAL